MTTVTAIGITRRLRALAAMGHPDVDVAGWLGITVTAVCGLQADGVADDAVAAGVVAVYAQWADRPGRCPETRRRARASGWRTAAAWDGEQLDVPPPVRRRYPRPPYVTDALVRQAWEATPAVVVELIKAAGPEDAGSAVVVRLAQAGMPDRQIAAVLRVGLNTVALLRTSAGVPPCDLAVARAWGRQHRSSPAPQPCPACLTKLTEAV